MSVNLNYIIVQLDNDYAYSFTFIHFIPCPELRGNALFNFNRFINKYRRRDSEKSEDKPVFRLNGCICNKGLLYL